MNSHHPIFKPPFKLSMVLIIIVFLSACLSSINKEIITATELRGWHEENFINVWPAWKNSCQAILKTKTSKLFNTCATINTIDGNDKTQIIRYFKENFIVRKLNSGKSKTALITGYYLPVLKGSFKKSSRFRYPIYALPKDTRLQSLSREQINANQSLLEPYALLWVDNKIDLFFLHIQGSGLIEFTDGGKKRVVYAGNNGYSYTSIGKYLKQNKYISEQQISLQTIKHWLKMHPGYVNEIFNKNARFIFFSLSHEVNSSVTGTLNVPLKTQRSIAVDPQFIELGSPVWLETTLPDPILGKRVFQRLMFAHDTGSAIKGYKRADVYFGDTDEAEFLAGNMKQSGKMYVFEPK